MANNKRKTLLSQFGSFFYRYLSCAVAPLTVLWLFCGVMTLPKECGGKEYSIAHAKLNDERIERITTAQGVQAAILQPWAQPIETLNRHRPDVQFTVKVPQAGLYTIQTHISVSPAGRQAILQAKDKYGGLSALVRINHGFASSRFLVEPPCTNFNRVYFNLGKYKLPQGESTIDFWLPHEVQFLSISVREAKGPVVPEAAQSYEPKIIPPTTHPRLWVTAESLLELRQRINQGENATVWEYVQAKADQQVEQARQAQTVCSDNEMAVDYDVNLTSMARSNAFVALIQNDGKRAKRTLDLFLPYLERVEFGNVRDVTRNVGQTMYVSALVYDWLYSWLTDEQKAILERRMLELAPHLKCSYPPFGKTILIGHGNESMILRDTLSVGIALYDVNPEPYRYCSWLIMENLVPVRAFQYQSPRHSQGRGYGFYRSQWEFQAALMYYAFSSDMVFDRNILSLRDYLLHLRTPSGELLPDGDGGAHLPSGTQGDIAFIISVLDKDPLMKGEAIRQFGIPNDRQDMILFLIFNDPDRKPVFRYDNLPRAIDTGAILPSHIIRTGWPGTNWFRGDLGKARFDPDSDDVIVEYKGGGWNTFNHQHLDAGAFQIYYRGWQTVDLGIYYFYGTPYDQGFNKKSGAHNSLFVLDPKEQSSNGSYNDGGQRVMPYTPSVPADCMKNPIFETGKVVKSEIKPNVYQPETALFKVDITAAYSDKVESYIRAFYFINTGRKDVPAALVVYDEVTARDPNFQKSWQINTFNKPELSETGFISEGLLPAGATIPTGRLSLTALLPTADNREIRSRCITDLPQEIQPTYKSRRSGNPAATGWQTRITPKAAVKTDRFLNVLQVLAPNAKPLEIKFKNGLANGCKDGDKSFELEIDGRKVEL